MDKYFFYFKKIIKKISLSIAYNYTVGWVD